MFRTCSSNRKKEKLKSADVRVGGAPVAAKVGEIMGVAAGAQVHELQFVKCGGD